MLKDEYLYSFVPDETPKTPREKNSSKKSEWAKKIEDDIRKLSEEAVKRNRDTLDAMYNLDSENFSENFNKVFSEYKDDVTSSQAAITALANKTEAQFQAVAKWQSETTTTISTIQGIANENQSSITILNQFKTETTSNLSAIDSRVSANESSINSFASFRTSVENGTIESISSISQKANANESSISSLVQWKSDVDSDIQSIASIQQQADQNHAAIKLVVSHSNTDYPEVNTASIVAAVNDDTSGVLINADKILLDGDTYFFKGTDINGDDSIKISGNDIIFNHPYNDSSSSASLVFKYDGLDSLETIGEIYTKDYGSGEPDDARFALVFQTYAIDASVIGSGMDAYAAIKFVSRGGMSFESRSSIYSSSSTYFTIDATDNTRIRANETYNTAAQYSPVGADTYVFCTDGIYYYDGYSAIKVVSI